MKVKVYNLHVPNSDKIKVYHTNFVTQQYVSLMFGMVQCCKALIFLPSPPLLSGSGRARRQETLGTRLSGSTTVNEF